MHFGSKPDYRSISEWIRDTQVLHNAYKDMKEDSELNAKIKQLEYQCMKEHLINIVGEDEARRILYEHGLESSI